MRLVRILGPSLAALLAHRARSLLAAGGVAIGIAAVSLTGAVGDGVQAEVLTRLGNLGSRMLVIRPAQVPKRAARKEVQGVVATLKAEDAEAIEKMRRVESTAPVFEGPARLKSESGSMATRVLGTTAAYFRLRDFAFQNGRAFGPEEDGLRVVVLGARTGRTLFPLADGVGRSLRIGGVGFEVVGILEPKGVSASGGDTDGQAFIPLRTAQRRLFDSRSLTSIMVGADESSSLDAMEAEIRALLRERHGLDARGLPDDFAIQGQARALAAQQKTASLLKLLTWGLAAISLLVGGTGILALMTLSVKERTPEIGLRMAVGARSRDILVQFLAEALALALLGGAAGAAVGVAGAWGISALTQWKVSVSLPTVAASLGVSLATGLAFGALPARRASMLLPVQALTQE
ncbi:MAG: ABC transporter permease [Deltaproteobacteria bacterium]|nr:ABC transporter permease [Deltaproteobacteria bacterium]